MTEFAAPARPLFPDVSGGTRVQIVDAALKQTATVRGNLYERADRHSRVHRAGSLLAFFPISAACASHRRMAYRSAPRRCLQRPSRFRPSAFCVFLLARAIASSPSNLSIASLIVQTAWVAFVTFLIWLDWFNPIPRPALAAVACGTAAALASRASKGARVNQFTSGLAIG